MKTINANDGSPRETIRKERMVRLPAQIESAAYMQQQNTPLGNVPDSSRVLVFDTEDLENEGLIDPSTRSILLKPDDRLDSIYDLRTERLIETIDNPPGLFIHTVHYTAYGFGDGPPNLAIAIFEDRSKGNR